MRGIAPHVPEVLAHVPPQRGVIHTTRVTQVEEVILSRQTTSCRCLMARTTDDGNIAGLPACAPRPSRAVSKGRFRFNANSHRPSLHFISSLLCSQSDRHSNHEALQSPERWYVARTKTASHSISTSERRVSGCFTTSPSVGVQGIPDPYTTKHGPKAAGNTQSACVWLLLLAVAFADQIATKGFSVFISLSTSTLQTPELTAWSVLMLVRHVSLTFAGEEQLCY